MTRLAKNSPKPPHLQPVSREGRGGRDCGRNDPLPVEDSLLLEPERYELREEPRYRFEVDRRDFLKMLGGGIVVCLVGRVARAQRPNRRGSGGGRGSRGRGASQELNAWLHLNESGEITACTGKVEIGQNIRTSLTQAVAEELRLSPIHIRLIMADTDLVPYDFGTAGSMTTRMMSPQLRKAAATLRELLLDLAAKELSVDRKALAISEGKISHAATNRSLTFGELAKKAQTTKTISGDVTLTPPSDWKIAGSSVPKVDGTSIVTGQREYASDIRRPGMMFGKVLRPESLHAKLVSVDLEKAKALPGVAVVHDGDFVGVAAPTAHAAEQALAAISAQWKAEKVVSDGRLFEDLKTGNDTEGGGGGGFGGRSNYSRGKIAEGMKAADHKLEASYTISYIAHVPLEPRASVAEWNDGKLTVWTGTQMPFRVRSELARVFGIADDKVRVIVPDMGSGYGGKHTGEAAVETARLAKAAGKPVKLNWTRQEEFTWGYFRPAGLIEVSAGVRKDGTLTAWEFHNYNSGGSAMRPLYEIPHQRIAFHASDAPLRQGSYRALAATANHFARESHIDDLAHAVGLDPLEFRLKNLKEERLRAVLEAAAKKFGWGPQNKPSLERGFGLACGSEKGSYVATCAEVAIDSRGKIHVVRAVTAFECGAIVNPEHLRNQIEGAMMMGLGGALFEAIRFDEDKIKNPKLALYRVPRFNDLPVLETVLLDRKDLPSVGAGETPIVAIGPAVGNAIFQATGKRLRSMPMAPRGLTS
jgi:CO/xanthine dehydrogenase Mo-binding subunit